MIAELSKSYRAVRCPHCKELQTRSEVLPELVTYIQRGRMAIVRTESP
jgi:phage FluMu protein Com